MVWGKYTFVMKGLGNLKASKGYIFFMFLLVNYRQQHTLTNFVAYKAVYVHVYMVSGALRYSKAAVGLA